MKKQVFKAITLVSFFVFFVGGVSAQEEPRIRANIPFAFIAGNKTLPAGEYTIDRPNANEHGLLLIRGVDSNAALFVSALEVQARQTPNKTELVFNQIGDKYFLSKIWVTGDDTGRELLKPRAERELKQETSAQAVAVQTIDS